ncbi:MAG: hypothetical protein LBQ37_02375 [Elusimicrobiota bacterium]|jgi:hypothetical protein|nr:hypothetical protein [Elusimicrobiota bacterium]
MYKCKYFTIKELVNPAFLKMTDETILWKVFDDRLLRAADKIRDMYGAIIINGGSLTDCGLRLDDSKTGAKFSAHKYGRALDLHIVEIEKKGLSKDAKITEYKKIRKELLQISEFNNLSFETGIYWLHIDTFNRSNRLFNP